MNYQNTIQFTKEQEIENNLKNKNIFEPEEINLTSPNNKYMIQAKNDNFPVSWKINSKFKYYNTKNKNEKENKKERNINNSYYNINNNDLDKLIHFTNVSSNKKFIVISKTGSIVSKISGLNNNNLNKNNNNNNSVNDNNNNTVSFQTNYYL